jgi:hypothetical protein
VVSLVHSTVAAGANRSGKLSKDAWNDEHVLTGTALTTLGFDADGASELLTGTALTDRLSLAVAGGAKGLVSGDDKTKLAGLLYATVYGVSASSLDNTAAITAALAAANGRDIVFPPGVLLYDGGGFIDLGTTIIGAGRHATIFRSRLASPTLGYLFKAAGKGSGLRGVGFDSDVAQTAGCYVWLAGTESFIADFAMAEDFNGVLMTGVAARTRNGRFTDGVASAIRIRAEGGDTSQIIDDVLMGAESSPNIATAGIRVRNSSALMVINSSVIQQGTGLLIDPYSSTGGTGDSGSVFSLYTNNCFFDNNTRALRVVPSGTGGVYRCRAANSWFSSSTSDGITLTGTTINGFHFESCHALLNGGSGVTTGTGCVDIKFLGGEYCQNAFGFYLGAAFNGLSIIGATIGAGAGVTGNTNAGIAFADTAFDYATVLGNEIRGNGGSAISGFPTGSNNLIFGNPGATLSRIPNTLNGLLDISGSSGGQIKFPAAQNASTDANTLDDYEEGTWTPALTFATPGNLAATYSSQVGNYTKIGRQVTVQFQIVTSGFTHTTASGDLTLTGFPFTNLGAAPMFGTTAWAGITKASFTHVIPFINAGGNTGRFRMSGSGQADYTITAADVPSGGSVQLRGTITYFV